MLPLLSTWAGVFRSFVASCIKPGSTCWYMNFRYKILTWIRSYNIPTLHYNPFCGGKVIKLATFWLTFEEHFRWLGGEIEREDIKNKFSYYVNWRQRNGSFCAYCNYNIRKGIALGMKWLTCLLLSNKDDFIKV